MTKSPHIAYWDSSVFVSYLKKEVTEGVQRWKTVQDLLNEAISGSVVIVTSSFTLVEVLKLKGGTPINESQENELIQFFEYPFIKIVEADREVCERARHYVWRHSLKPKDAVHLATAEIASLSVKITDLFSWDSDFISLNGKGVVRFNLSHPFQKQPLLWNYDGTPTEQTEDEENSESEPIDDGGLRPSVEGDAQDATATSGQESPGEEG